VDGALNIPAGTKIASYGAWAVDPKTDDRPLVLLATNQDHARDIWEHLVRVGIDQVAGYITDLDGLPLVTTRMIQREELESFVALFVLNVSNSTEHAEGAIAGSRQFNAGLVLCVQEDLLTSGTIAAFCQSGVLNSVAASALRRPGEDVIELDGSFAGWKAWK